MRTLVASDPHGFKAAVRALLENGVFRVLGLDNTEIFRHAPFSA